MNEDPTEPVIPKRACARCPEEGERWIEWPSEQHGAGPYWLCQACVDVQAEERVQWHLRNMDS